MEQPIDIGGPAQPLLTISGMVKHFPLRKTAFGARTVVRAVDGVDFQVMKGETLGGGGEGGCGKPTAARFRMQLRNPARAQVGWDGRAIGGRDLPLKEFRR